MADNRRNHRRGRGLHRRPAENHNNPFAVDWLKFADSTSGTFFSNLQRDIVATFQKMVDNPLQTIIGIPAFISSIVSVFSYLFSSGGGSRAVSYSTSPLLSSFPARIMVFAIVTASLGWTISSLCIWLTRSRSPWSRGMSHFITIIGALFLAATIDWIFAPDIPRFPGLVLLLVASGVALSVLMARTNYLLTHEPDRQVIHVRAELLMSFAGSAMLLVLLRELTGL